MRRLVYALLLTGLCIFSNSQANWGSYVPDWHQYIPDDEWDDDWSSDHDKDDGDDDDWESGWGGNVYYGPTKISGQTLDDVTIYGPAALKNCKIKHQTKVQGPLKALDCVFHSLSVKGPAALDSVEVKTTFNIYGPIVARDSKFAEISVASEKVKFSNCTIKELRVKKSGNQTQQVVYLDNGCKVDSIIFDRKGGRVVLKDSASTVEHISGGSTSSKSS